MKVKTLLLITGLITCLFSTSFASVDSEFVQGPVNSADPNVAFVPQGATTNDMEWCQPCGGWVRKDVALLAKTAKARTAQKAAVEEDSSGGQR